MLAHERSYALAASLFRNDVTAVAYMRAIARLIWLDVVSTKNLSGLITGYKSGSGNLCPSGADFIFACVRRVSVCVAFRERGVKDRPKRGPIGDLKGANGYCHGNLTCIRQNCLNP